MRRKLKIKDLTWFSFFFFILLTSIFACGFVYEKHLTGHYYIIGVDSNEDLSLSYKIDSDSFVGKAPGELLEYGFNDTFLVAKTKEYSRPEPQYYIIDMTKDSALALEEKFRVGPVSELDYDKMWRSRLNVVLKKVQK